MPRNCTRNIRNTSIYRAKLLLVSRDLSNQIKDFNYYSEDFNADYNKDYFDLEPRERTFEPWEQELKYKIIEKWNDVFSKYALTSVNMSSIFRKRDGYAEALASLACTLVDNAKKIEVLQEYSLELSEIYHSILSGQGFRVSIAFQGFIDMFYECHASGKLKVLEAQEISLHEICSMSREARANADEICSMSKEARANADETFKNLIDIFYECHASGKLKVFKEQGVSPYDICNMLSILSRADASASARFKEFTDTLHKCDTLGKLEELKAQGVSTHDICSVLSLLSRTGPNAGTELKGLIDMFYECSVSGKLQEDEFKAQGTVQQDISSASSEEGASAGVCKRSTDTLSDNELLGYDTEYNQCILV